MGEMGSAGEDGAEAGYKGFVNSTGKVVSGKDEEGERCWEIITRT